MKTVCFFALFLAFLPQSLFAQSLTVREAHGMGCHKTSGPLLAQELVRAEIDALQDLHPETRQQMCRLANSISYWEGCEFR